MFEKLDSTDRHLITLLQASARETAANLARKLGIARTTVISRIARLEKNGVVVGYGVRLGRKIEGASLRSFVGISVLPKAGPVVLRMLNRIPEIEELCAVSGEFDYMAILKCETTERLDHVLDEIGAIEGVKQTTTSIVLACKIDRRTTV